MLSLHELQRSFRQALLTGDDGALTALIEPADRLDVHRNNVLASLTAALKDLFPVVCRLVDERFFDYAADSFVRAQPPRQPCLDDYGRDFPDFLAAFPPCRDLPYLADVARLEWLLHIAARAPEIDPLQPAALAEVDAAQLPSLVLRLQPSCGYLASRWPADRIWRANRAADTGSTDLDAGGVHLEVRRHAGDVELRHLPEDDFVFRAALSRGTPFVAATAMALAADPGFDAASALRQLFADGAVIRFTFIEGSPGS